MAGHELPDLELLNTRAYERVACLVDQAHTQTLRAAASDIVPQIREFVARAAERDASSTARESLVPSVIIEVGMANGDRRDLGQALAWVLAQEQELSARIVSLGGGMVSSRKGQNGMAAHTADVLILDDLEGIDKVAFSDFILRLSESRAALEVLVMLVSPAVGFPATLKLPCCGLLQVLHLAGPSPLRCFSKMVADLFVLSQCPVGIDPSILQYLYTLFVRHMSLSISTHHLKLVAHHFFQASPCRHLCLALEPEFRADIVRNIGDGKLEGVQDAPVMPEGDDEDDDGDGTALAQRVASMVYRNRCRRWAKMVLFKSLRVLSGSEHEEHPGAMLGLQLVVLGGGERLAKRVQSAFGTLSDAKASVLARLLTGLKSVYAEVATSGDHNSGTHVNLDAHDNLDEEVQGPLADLRAKVAELALLNIENISDGAVLDGIRFESMCLLQAIYASASCGPLVSDGETNIETDLSVPVYYLEELGRQFDPEPRHTIRHALEHPASYNCDVGPGSVAFHCLQGATAAADWFTPFASEECSGWSTDAHAGSHAFIRAVADLDYVGAVQMSNKDGARFERMLF
jgi:hypothetical protein